LTYLLLFLSAFLAATFVPFSSEIHFAIVAENEGIWLAVLFATIGNSLGGIFTYYLGWLAKWTWIEKYCRVKREKVENFKGVIQKYGGWMGILCWLPFVGDIIAIGLGVFRVSKTQVFVTMTIGKAVRYIAVGLFFID